MEEAVIIAQIQAVHIMELYNIVERAQKRKILQPLSHRLSGERNGSLS